MVQQERINFLSQTNKQPAQIPDDEAATTTSTIDETG
jgi:hypothetical protein